MKSTRSSSLTDDDLRAMIDDKLIAGTPRARALSPTIPMLRGTAQNPDVYFQGRETVNPYLRCHARTLSRRRWINLPA